MSSASSSFAQVSIDDMQREYHDTLGRWSAAKRFYEKWSSDPAFRQEVARDVDAALAAYNIPLDSSLVYNLLDCAGRDCIGEAELHKGMEEVAWTKQLFSTFFYRHHCMPEDTSIQQWRQRHIARQLFDLGRHHVDMNIHSSLAIELSKGCSVGCWFCALSPDRSATHFRATDENVSFAREVFSELQASLGSAARSGFLYWATEPFDNPDYEVFADMFCDVVGVYPPTTSAIPMKDPARTRAFLQKSQMMGAWQNRFSVLSVPMMNKVHQEFSASELALVECLPLNRETGFAYGMAGRFREAVAAKPELAVRYREKANSMEWAEEYTEGGDPDQHGTICCVTGLLVKMVEGTVSVISGCTADDDHPTGIRTYLTESFSDIASFREALSRCLTVMRRTGYVASSPLRLFPYISFVEEGDTLLLRGRFASSVRFRLGSERAVVLQVMEHARRGDMSFQDTALRVAEAVRCTADEVHTQMSRFFAHGIFQEDEV